MIDPLQDYPYTRAVIEGHEWWALVDEKAEDFLPRLPDCSIDALVTDPPAGIGLMDKEWDDPRKWDAFRRARNPSDAGRNSVFGRASNHAPHSYGESDRDVFVAWLASVMTEALRALKPGGHALVWALPRTSHWTAWALEEAGFEIRDCVYHIFGNGFPKSMDVSKAIDKKLGAERPVIGLRPDAAKLNKSVQEAPGGWTTARREPNMTAPGSDAAAQWEGWSTALKPATECWWLVRKPLEKGLTVAENILKWGTGALNIDGCRIRRGVNDRHEYGVDGDEGCGTANVYGFRPQDRSPYNPHAAGRWPAHVVWSHDEDCTEGSCMTSCAVAELDRQSGTSKSRKGKSRAAKQPGTGWGMTKTGAEYDDKGGASRFFFVAKPSRKEREAGLDHLVRTEAPARNEVDRGSAKNNHPTVKGIELMRYLCRLITPRGGVILDSFAGSGSTGCAALLEGFRFVGIECEKAYVEIASARIAYWASWI